MNILKNVFLTPGYVMNAFWFLAYLNPTEWGSKRNTAKTARMNSKAGRKFTRWAFSLIFWPSFLFFVISAFLPVQS
jgi:hypothetical protein